MVSKERVNKVDKEENREEHHEEWTEQGHGEDDDSVKKPKAPNEESKFTEFSIPDADRTPESAADLLDGADAMEAGTAQLALCMLPTH